MMHPSRVYHTGLDTTTGIRYILVGFVRVVGHPWSRDTMWRRFGTLTKCLSTTYLRPKKTFHVLDTGKAYTGEAYTGKDELLDFSQPVCASWLRVYLYELSFVWKEFFYRKVEDPIFDTAIKVVLLGLLLAIGFVFIGIVRLCCQNDDDDDDEAGEEKDTPMHFRPHTLPSTSTSEGTGTSSSTDLSTATLPLLPSPDSVSTSASYVRRRRDTHKRLTAQALGSTDNPHALFGITIEED
jgi:hypothetical protein